MALGENFMPLSQAFLESIHPTAAPLLAEVEGPPFSWSRAR